MEIVVERLQGHNIKPSVQRIAIMKYLMEHRTHPTVDEIYTALSPTIPDALKNNSLQHTENFERTRSCTDADH